MELFNKLKNIKENVLSRDSPPRPLSSREYARQNCDKVTRQQVSNDNAQHLQQPPPQSYGKPDCSAAESEKNFPDVPVTQVKKTVSHFKTIRNIVTLIHLGLVIAWMVLDPLVCSAVMSLLGELHPPVDTQYAQPLSFVHDSSDRQMTEYVLAYDNSGSMSDSLEKRNVAIQAIIRSLPYEGSHATAFPFSNESSETLQDILPMSEDELRETIEGVVQGSGDAKGGTDLGLMMDLAIGRFSDLGQDSSMRHVLFIITDGWSDGADGIAKARDEKFFSMCKDNREKVDIYVIYVSENRTILQNLATELHTQPIELADNNADTLNVNRNRLVEWEVGSNGTRKEYAKILSIPDLDLLETALLLLQYANTDADSVFYRTAEKDAIVSFRIPALCTQELTIALSDGASVQETLCDLKWEGNNALDLLKTAVTGDNPSVVTIRKEDGLPAGLYTMKIKTETKLSVVFSYQNNFKVQFGLENIDNPMMPPAGIETALQMRLLRPDDTPMQEEDSVVLSMRVEYLEEDEPAKPCCELNNREKITFKSLKEGAQLRFHPEIICSGIREKLDGFWDVQPSEPPESKPQNFLCKFAHWCQNSTHLHNILSGLPEPDPFIDILDRSIPMLRLLLGVLTAVVFFMWFYTWKSFIDTKIAERQHREEQWQKEIQLTDDFVGAGICWKITEEGWIRKKSYVGSLGPKDDNGRFRQGCDLSKTFVCCMENSKLVKRRNPLKFCRWRYSPERHRTELVLMVDNQTIIKYEENNLLYYEISKPSGSKLKCFGVDEEHPSGIVEIKTRTLEGKFHLKNYYKREALPNLARGEH